MVNAVTQSTDSPFTDTALERPPHSWLCIVMKQVLCDGAAEFKTNQQTSKQANQNPETCLVGKAGPDCGGNTLLQVGILKDDGRVLAPQLQGEPLAVGSTQLCDPLGCGLAPGEGDEGHLRMGHQGLAYPGPCSEHNIHHTGWNTWMGNSISYRKYSQYVEELRLHGDSPWKSNRWE